MLCTSTDFLLMSPTYVPRRYVYLDDYQTFKFIISFYFAFRKIAKSDY